MPWFYRNCEQQFHARKRGIRAKAIHLTSREATIILLVLYCTIHKCISFSPHISKQVSLLHASPSESKTIEIQSKPIKPVLTSEAQPRIKQRQYTKKSRDDSNEQKRRGAYNNKYRKPRQRCSAAQNLKRRIRFLYSKAR